MLLGSDIRILVSIFAMPNIAKIYEKGIIATINTTEFCLCILLCNFALAFFLPKFCMEIKIIRLLLLISNETRMTIDCKR